MNETDATARIQQMLAGLPTIKGIHFPDSRRVTANGWVDWVFLGPNGVLFREFKGTDDTLSPEQRLIIKLLDYSDLNVSVWWPKDLRYGGVAEQQLRAIA